MRKKVVWNKVTTFSKIVAMTLFVILPFVAFVLGMKYQRMLILGY